MSPHDAEDYYGIDRGKGGAYVEFDVADHEVRQDMNPITGVRELSIVGNVDLTGRNPAGHVN